MQVVLNAVGLSEYARMQLSRGESAVEKMMARVGQVADVVVIVAAEESVAMACQKMGAQAGARVESIVAPSPTVGAICERLQAHITEPILFYARADAPFLDVELLMRMRDIHTNYAAEFTFADGYPFGFAPEIMNSELVPLVPRLAKEDEALTIDTTLFSLLQRDINAFDIETELAPTDMRALRIELHCNSRNNYRICKALCDITEKEKSDPLAALSAHPELLRQAPMFVSIELTARRAQEVS